jgi:hypothetical protein
VAMSTSTRVNPRRSAFLFEREFSRERYIGAVFPEHCLCRQWEAGGGELSAEEELLAGHGRTKSSGDQTWARVTDATDRDWRGVA